MSYHLIAKLCYTVEYAREKKKRHTVTLINPGNSIIEGQDAMLVIVLVRAIDFNLIL